MSDKLTSAEIVALHARAVADAKAANIAENVKAAQALEKFAKVARTLACVLVADETAAAMK
jgi:hypothetical protein